jgi:hypothetical protein
LTLLLSILHPQILRAAVWVVPQIVALVKGAAAEELDELFLVNFSMWHAKAI